MYIFKSVYHACLGLVGKLFVLDELKLYVPKKLNYVTLTDKSTSLAHSLTFILLFRLQRINLFINVFGIIVIWRLLMNRFKLAKSLWNFLMGWAMKIFKSLPTLVKSS